jgi:hypothetical protein
VTQPNSIDGFPRALLAPSPRSAAVDLGQHHIFEHGSIWQEPKGLKHEPNPLTAEPSTLVLSQPSRVDAFKEQSAASRAVKAADEMKQG